MKIPTHKSTLQSRTIERIRTDRTLNPKGLGPREFIDQFYALSLGKVGNISDELCALLGISYHTLYEIRKTLKCTFYTLKKAPRRVPMGTIRMADNSPTTDWRTRRNRLMDRARQGDKGAALTLAKEHNLRILSPAEIRAYEHKPGRKQCLGF